MERWIAFAAYALLSLIFAAYVARRVTEAARFSPRASRFFFLLAWWTGPVLTVAGQSLKETTVAPLAAWGSAAGWIVMLALLLSAVLLLPVDGLSLVERLVRRLRPLPTPPKNPAPKSPAPPEAKSPYVSRREAVRRVAVGGALAVGTGAAFTATLFGRHDYATEEIAFRIPGLSPRLSGFRIVQLSDVHFGSYVGATEMRSALALVRRARPDLIVLTGDLVDHDMAYAPMLGRFVRSLSDLGARHGVAAIPGNHEYYTGVDTLMDTIDAAGGTVLRNAGRVIGEPSAAFSLLGVDDVMAPRLSDGGRRRPDLARALADVPPDLPRVLLCHNPAFFPAAAQRVDLQLSGHTHGGQINLGVRPADLLLRYVAGRYEEGRSQLYVNRGFGTAGPPARLGAPPEVTVAVLVAA